MTILEKYFCNKPMMINEHAIPMVQKHHIEQAFGCVTVIPIHGVLTKRYSAFGDFFSVTSYEEIYEDIAEAVVDSKVEQIILDIDSPGGEVSGLFDLCEFINQAKTEKPIIAYANDDCFSAAYAIAASCSKILINKTSGVGSIGVIATHLNVSEFDKKEGLKYTTIFKGARKNDLNPHESLTDEALSGLDKELTRLYEMFVDLVAKGRDIAVAKIKSTEAGIFYGDEAIKAGLADEIINSFKHINLNINQINNNTFKMEKIMTKELEEKITEPEINQQTEELIEERKPIEIALPANEAKGSEDPPKIAEVESSSYKAEIAEIARLCKLAKMPEKLAEFIESGISVADARDSLMKALASKTDDIRSTISSTAKITESPVVAAALSRKHAPNL